MALLFLMGLLGTVAWRGTTPAAEAGEDAELRHIGNLLLLSGESNVSRLMVCEVTTWGMLSCPERLKPGALGRGSKGSDQPVMNLKETRHET